MSGSGGRNGRVAGGGRLGRGRNGATSAGRGLRYLSADAGHNGRVRRRGLDGSRQAAGAGRVSSGERCGCESREGRERLGRVGGESLSRVRSEGLAWVRSLTRSLNRTSRVGGLARGLNRACGIRSLTGCLDWASGVGSLAGGFDRTGRGRSLTRCLYGAGRGRSLTRRLYGAGRVGSFTRSLNRSSRIRSLTGCLNRSSGGRGLARGLNGTSGVRGESLGDGRSLDRGHRADGSTDRDGLSGGMRLARLAGAAGNLRSARSDSADSGRVDGRGGVLSSRGRRRIARSSGAGRRVSLSQACGRVLLGSVGGGKSWSSSSLRSGRYRAYCSSEGDSLSSDVRSTRAVGDSRRARSNGVPGRRVDSGSSVPGGAQRCAQRYCATGNAGGVLYSSGRNVGRDGDGRNRRAGHTSGDRGGTNRDRRAVRGRVTNGDRGRAGRNRCAVGRNASRNSGGTSRN